jgi:hypothetical protein
VHGRRGQRRRRLLQLGQRGAVRRRHVLGQAGLEDRQRLAELHGAALELAEHLEQLLGGARLQLRGDELGGAAAQALAEPIVARPATPSGRPASLADRVTARRGMSLTRPVSLLCKAAPGGARRQVLAPSRRPARSRVHPQSGCTGQVRRRQRQSGSTISSVPPSAAGSVVASTIASTCIAAWAATASASGPSHPARPHRPPGSWWTGPASTGRGRCG